ncbi:2,3-bisphosphoglycerate-independent phosphoglycerate mutase [Candidatus Uhrbacteria bacterium]|nr:2,3-bisphosphoglycerate-independent phosphoglycerate mutase [Candidatus Uhrbacteria bacterium]
MNGRRPKPAVLLILDGFGIAPAGEGNAVSQAKMPNLKRLVQHYPAMTLRASGEAVGLSWGEMGNSEVGHLAIGAGRVYYQTLPRINKAIEDKSFFENEAFLQAAAFVKSSGGTLHLIGMVSPGRVHSMDDHLHALLALCKQQSCKHVAVHAILDGRDTMYNAGADFVTALQTKMKELKVGVLATLAGRYYAMDRDNRWDRVEKAYNAMVKGEGVYAKDALGAIKESYAEEVFDEEFEPTVLVDGDKPLATVKEGDAVVLFNFRADRMREITKAFCLPGFELFKRNYIPNIFVVTMTEYEKNLPVVVAFPSQEIKHTLSEVIAEQDLKQLHIAETEKYAHATFFFNGMKEAAVKGEERVIVPSPKVSVYDETPMMSTKEIADRLLKEIRAGKFDVMVANFANPDMVAHTGNLEATIEALEVDDGFIGKIADALLDQGGVLFVTADHGNAEEVRNVVSGEIDKEHSTNPVPFIVVSKAFEGQASPVGEIPNGDLSLVPPVGMLADVAPTMLSVLGISQPPEMTGQPLL